MTLDGRLRRGAIKEIHRLCIQTLFEGSESRDGVTDAPASAVCIAPDPVAAKALRPPQNLLLQLSQIQEEDESKTSSRNSIDKAAAGAGNGTGGPGTPGATVRVVDHQAPSPAVSARHIIVINGGKEEGGDNEDELDTDQSDTEEAGPEVEVHRVEEEEDDDSAAAAVSSSDQDASDSSGVSGVSGSKHARISESFSNASNSDIEVVKERITRT